MKGVAWTDKESNFKNENIVLGFQCAALMLYFSVTALINYAGCSSRQMWQSFKYYPLLRNRKLGASSTFSSERARDSPLELVETKTERERECLSSLLCCAQNHNRRLERQSNRNLFLGDRVCDVHVNGWRLKNVPLLQICSRVWPFVSC